MYSTSIDQSIIGEEPLSIRIQGNPYSAVMRTPGDEIPHVAGFCLGEGIVDKPDDFTSFIYKQLKGMKNDFLAMRRLSSKR